MELVSSNCFMISTFITLFSLFVVLKLLTIKTSSKQLRLPPGPRKLPIIGNLHQLVSRTTLPHRRLQELAGVHGPIMHLRLGEVPTVVVSSAETAQQVFKTHDINFANRPKLMVGKIIYYDFSDMGLAPYGEYWRQLRKIATLELFTTKRVQSFRSIREEEVASLVHSIASKAHSGSVVNLSDDLFRLLFNITSRVVFSREGKDQDAFKALLTKLLDVASGFSIVDIYPSIKLLHSIGGMERKLEEMVEQANKILEPIIEEHKPMPNQARSQEDLVDVLLKFHKDNAPNSDFSLTTDNIKGIILEMFVGGSETSYATIEWAMSELLKNQSAMKKAQDEVRRVYRAKGMVDETSLNELKFLKLVIKETLRLHPVAPLLVPRECMELCQINGYDIPPKTRVIVNAWAIGKDPNHWPEPNMFKPERFDGSSIDYKGANFELIPFGAGRRMCPGMMLGVATIELALAALLYHFDWKLPLGVELENLNMDELFGITVRRKDELHLVATRCASPSLIFFFLIVKNL